MSSEQISGYVDEEAKEMFVTHAEAADMSLSEWVAEACQEKAERSALADQATRFKVERRLLSMVDEAADRAAEEIVDDVATELAEQIEEFDQDALEAEPNGVEGNGESDPYDSWGDE